MRNYYHKYSASIYWDMAPCPLSLGFVCVRCIWIRRSERQRILLKIANELTMPKTLENIITYAIYHCAQHRVFGMCVHTPIGRFRIHLTSVCVFMRFCVNERPQQTQVMWVFFSHSAPILLFVSPKPLQEVRDIQKWTSFFLFSPHIHLTRAVARKKCVFHVRNSKSLSPGDQSPFLSVQHQNESWKQRRGKKTYK